MAGPQIAHLFFIQGGAALDSLRRSHGSVVHVGRGVFEVRCGPSDFKMVLAQVRFFVFVQLGSQLGRIALQIKLDVRL